MDAKRTKVYINYKNIKHACMAGLAPSLVFVRDTVDRDNFSETLEHFNNYAKNMSKWLIHVRKNMKNGSTLLDEIQLDSSDRGKEEIEKKTIANDNKEKITHG